MANDNNNNNNESSLTRPLNEEEELHEDHQYSHFSEYNKIYILIIILSELNHSMIFDTNTYDFKTIPTLS